jgi:hypothetical protein
VEAVIAAFGEPTGHLRGVAEGVVLADAKRIHSPGPLKGAADVDDYTQ